MTQWFKPSKEEWVRVHNLPYYMRSGRRIHYEYDDVGKMIYYELDGTDFSMYSWR